MIAGLDTYEAIVLSALAVSCSMLGILIFLVLKLRHNPNSHKSVSPANFGDLSLIDRASTNKQRILEKIECLFEQRTGLSSALIRVAIETNTDQKIESADEYLTFAMQYLQLLTNELAEIIEIASGQESGACTVSIKLLVDGDEQDSPTIHSAFRSSRTRLARELAMDGLEPFSIEDHSILNKIYHDEKLEAFWGQNDLAKTSLNHNVIMQNWANHYKSAAYFAIHDPNVKNDFEEWQDSILGFICIDSASNFKNFQELKVITSIVSTAAYYCLYAASAVELVTEEQG